jgi:hypothetical protein
MKIYLFIIVVLCETFAISAQETATSSNKSEIPRIMRSSLGMSGSTNNIVTKKGTYNVSQSIGQISVIGTSFNNGYYLRQGFQQPLNKISIIQDFDLHNDLIAKIYPNPFEQSVSISFSETLKEDIDVTVFDVRGKRVYSKKFSPAKFIQLKLESISSGAYFLKATSNNKQFNAKLLKK